MRSRLPAPRWVILPALAMVIAAGRLLMEPAPGAGESPWRTLEPGLELGIFAAPLPAPVGDGRIHVLRIEPAHFTLRLLSASASDEGRLLTARQWCEEHDLVAAINASMYQADYRTSVSLMVGPTHTNNAHVSRDNAVLAFDARNDSLPPIQIIDRECQDFEALRAGYRSLVQSIRMISCDRRNVWAPQERRWSTAAIGMDRQGRVLFVHVRTPYSTHDLIDMLLELPIELVRAMYSEGGPEAQLYVRAGAAGKEKIELIGSFESGFHEADDVTLALPVPNVIGIERRAR